VLCLIVIAEKSVLLRQERVKQQRKNIGGRYSIREREEQFLKQQDMMHATAEAN